MSEEAGAAQPIADTLAISTARARLDEALLAFNRHAILIERHRRAVEQFRFSRHAFEAAAAERTALRDERERAVLQRAAVREAVGDFVRLMRDAGLPPEIVLVAVKRRLILTVSAEHPPAPTLDATLMESDASAWAIKAYYEAA